MSSVFISRHSMSYSQGPEIVESIDQVMQGSQSLSMSQQLNSSPNDSAISINRTAPLPPPSPLTSHPTSPRKEKASSSRRPNSSGGQGSSASGRSERDRKSSMRGVKESDDESGRSGNATTASTAPSSRGGMNGNITDFFSSEVFHIVLHNPTTAHRLLRFCQSRACGENMEFLQKVRT
jgi:hypothetical protein